MHVGIRRYGLRPIALGAAILIFLVISAPAAIEAGNVPEPPVVKNTGVFKIEFKGKDFIVVHERRFIITDKTAIWNLFGQNIDLKGLIIPCEAKITYRIIPNREDLECLEIKVKRHLTRPK
jgi:hypothetical protein